MSELKVCNLCHKKPVLRNVNGNGITDSNFLYKCNSKNCLNFSVAYTGIDEEIARINWNAHMIEIQRCNHCQAIFDQKLQECPNCGKDDALMFPFEHCRKDWFWQGVKIKTSKNKAILKIAKKYKIKILFDFQDCPYNQGASANDTIFLGKFDDEDVKLFAFFHELGHCIGMLGSPRVSHYLCKLSNEGAAWERGIELAAKHGYIYDYNSKEFEYGRKCLKSYFNSEYNELRDEEKGVKQ